MVKTTNQIDTNTIQKWWKQENRTWDSHWSAGDPHFDERMISYDFHTLYTLAACLSFRTRGFLELNTKHPVMVYLSIPWWKMSHMSQPVSPCFTSCSTFSTYSQHITAWPIDGPVSLGPQKPIWQDISRSGAPVPCPRASARALTMWASMGRWRWMQWRSCEISPLQWGNSMGNSVHHGDQWVLQRL